MSARSGSVLGESHVPVDLRPKIRKKSIVWFRGEYEFLSNFYMKVQWDGDFGWKSNEHYFQGNKSQENARILLIANAPTCMDAKRMGRNVPLRADWEAVKHQVMLDGLRIKFPSPRSSLGKKLLATGDRLLVEGNGHGDVYWGMVHNANEDEWTGLNWLGKLLMLRRAELRSLL